MTETLKFGAVNRKPDIRLAKDMGEVIIDKEWLEKNKNAELYYMYRDLWKEGDKEKIRKNQLRYDITIIPARNIGNEYVKTKGHYHPESSSGITYPEIYEVLEGKAHYILQKKSSPGRLDDVVFMEVEEGEKALIPPNYGHITINPANKALKMANWVDRTFDSIYEDILELGGGAYFELRDDELVKNDNYKKIPDIRRAEPTEISEIGIETGKDMYELIEEPMNLNFLSNPKADQPIFNQVL